MQPLAALQHSVAKALATGRIGTPVAVRLALNLSVDHGHLERTAAWGLDVAAGWLNSRPQSLAAAGSVESGQIALLASMTGGQSALITVGSPGVGPSRIQAQIIGNRGQLSWEPGETQDIGQAAELDAGGSSGSLLEQIRESLRRGSAVPCEANSLDDQRRAGEVSIPRFSLDRPKVSRPKLGPTPPPYGVLLVAGDHTHQSNYAPLFAADPRCRLVGLTDEPNLTPRRKELNEQLARTLKIPLLPDLQQALARDDVHIVSICAEPMRRGEIILAAAKAGKHLYLDKPLAATRDDLQQIATATLNSNTVHHMFSLVRSATATRARQWITSGELGEVVAAHFDLHFAKGHAGTAKLGTPRSESASPDCYERAEAKRELTNVGVYPLVLLLWLLEARVEAVYATTGNFFFREHHELDMEDFGQVLLWLEGGRVSTISVGRTGWRSHPAGGVNRVMLVGTKRTAIVDAHRPRVEAWTDAESWTAPLRNPADPMAMWSGSLTGTYAARPKLAWATPDDAAAEEDVKFFLDCVEQGRKSDVPVELAGRASEVLLAAYQSAATSRVVRFSAE